MLYSRIAIYHDIQQFIEAGSRCAIYNVIQPSIQSACKILRRVTHLQYIVYMLYSMYGIQHACYIAYMLYSRHAIYYAMQHLLRLAQGVLYIMAYSLVCSLYARCYNVSLTSSIQYICDIAYMLYSMLAIQHIYYILEVSDTL